MYKIKRFSQLVEKDFASIGEGRKKVGNEEWKIASHVVFYMAKNIEVSHWIDDELPTSIYNVTKSYPSNKYNSMSYSEMFPSYLGGERIPSVAAKVLKKADEEGCSMDMIAYFKSDEFIDLLKDLSNRLDEVKNSLKRIPNSNSSSDKEIIKSVFKSMRADYKLYERFNFN